MSVHVTKMSKVLHRFLQIIVYLKKIIIMLLKVFETKLKDTETVVVNVFSPVLIYIQISKTLDLQKNILDVHKFIVTRSKYFSDKSLWKLLFIIL